MSRKIRIAVVGGGAAGMMAAIIAARNNAEVIILEQMNRVGKKILATGNGRCNLTNANIDIKNYHGSNPKFAYTALKEFDEEQTIQFFEYLGISCKIEEGGKVFPYSDQASSVLDVLRYELQHLNIQEQCDSEVISIKKEKNEFSLNLKDGKKIKADRVIIATGGKASPNLGSKGNGYGLVKSFGHKTTNIFPSLVQLKLDADFLKGIKGVSFMGNASVGIDEEVVRTEYGEILFTDYGISGPPILQLSRQAGAGIEKNKKPWIIIDMFPELQRNEVETMLKIRLGYQIEKELDFSFIGLLNKRLINVVLKEAKISDLHKKCSEVTDKEIANIVNILKEWKLYVTGTQSFANAQVTAGGVDVRDIDNKTMESKLVQGIYFAGEILDIDGDCGGFNLQWAWSSGHQAGYYASQF